MTKEKWFKLYNEECDRHIRNRLSVKEPKDWAAIKDSFLNMIKNVDETTEVYEMENKEKA